MWLPSDVNVLATGHNFMNDLCFGVWRGVLGLKCVGLHWSGAPMGVDKYTL